MAGLNTIKNNLTGVVKARNLVSPKPIPRKAPSIAQGVMHNESPYIKGVKRAHSSDTTNAARMVKWKANDPGGMLNYEKKRRTSNASTVRLMDNTYDRSLVAPSARK